MACPECLQVHPAGKKDTKSRVTQSCDSISQGGVMVKSYGYDDAGRTTSVTTSAGTTNLAYDYENRLTSITGPGGLNDSFTYNGLDTRVSKTDGSGTHSYRRAGAAPTSPVLNDGTAEYTPGVSRSASSGTVFFGKDRMGSDVLQISSSQTATSERQFDAFGNLVSSSGTPQGPFGFDGLMLLGHRYYDSSTGRFLTRDPIKDGQNWYEYVSNSPTVWSDKSGENKFTVLISDVWDIVKGVRYPSPTGEGLGLVTTAKLATLPILYVIYKLAVDTHREPPLTNPIIGQPMKPDPPAPTSGEGASNPDSWGYQRAHMFDDE